MFFKAVLITKDVIGDLKVNYLERMDGVLDLMLEKEAENDPKEYFKVSDAHKDSVSSKNGR